MYKYTELWQGPQALDIELEPSLLFYFNQWGKGLSNCMSPPRAPCADFQSGIRISANSVGNIDTAKSQQKSIKQFAADGKGSQHWIQVIWII